MSIVQENKGLTHQNEFPLFHFLKTSVLLLCTTNLSGYFHPVGKPGLAVQSHAGFAFVTSRWKSTPSGQCAVLRDSYIFWLLQCEREKTIWTGCELLRLLLEVNSSHAAELPWRPPGEETLQEDFFPCIKGPTTPLLSPNPRKGSPHMGRRRGLREGALLTQRKVL